MINVDHPGAFMKKLYQQSWFDIPFREIAGMSSHCLAGADFYREFYNRFFVRYASWENLPPTWRQHKQEVADKLCEFMDVAKASVLSIGCGIGYVERQLLVAGFSADRLDVSEVTDVALRWISKKLPPSQVHVGTLPECLPHGKLWDVIYLSGVEYALDQGSLENLLTALRSRLRVGGVCIVVSASFVHPSPRPAERVLAAAKEMVKCFLDITRLRQRGQFWGWARTPDELEGSLRSAGFSSVLSGYVEPSHICYWVAGRQ